jgi:hypothetical protein
MSSYNLTQCLGFNLIKMLCVIVEQAYLGVVANEFIRSQCKSNRMHTDIYLYM